MMRRSGCNPCAATAHVSPNTTAVARPLPAINQLRSVVNRARSAHRHHLVVAKHTPTQLEDAASAETHAMATQTRALVMGALHQLPTRQREVLVLRYYSDLSEAEIADALEISRGAVKSHAHRGLTTLRTTLEEHR